MTATLLTDARELFALMRGQAHNPLLDQWQLARRRRSLRLGFHGRLKQPQASWLLPLFIPIIIWMNQSIGQSMLDLLPMVLSCLLLLAWLLPRLKLLLRIALTIAVATTLAIMIHVDGNYLFSSFWPDFHNTDGSGQLILLQLLAGIYCLQAIGRAIQHGMLLTGSQSSFHPEQDASDIRNSLLDDREILQAFIAFHFPSLLGSFAWLSLFSGMELTAYIGEIHLVEAMLVSFGLGFVILLFSLCACLLLMMFVVQLRPHLPVRLAAIGLCSLILLGQLAQVFLFRYFALDYHSYNIRFLFDVAAITPHHMRTWLMMLALSWLFAIHPARLLARLSAQRRQILASSVLLLFIAYLLLFMVAVSNEALLIVRPAYAELEEYLQGVCWSLLMILGWVSLLLASQYSRFMRLVAMLAPLAGLILLYGLTFKLGNAGFVPAEFVLLLLTTSAFSIIGSEPVFNFMIAYIYRDYQNVSLIVAHALLCGALQFFMLFLMHRLALMAINRWRRLAE